MTARISIFILGACLLSTGCDTLGRWEKENSIAAKRYDDRYRFRTWPESEMIHVVRLQRVMTTDCHLGPDFTIHYFTFSPVTSLAIYHGGNPRWEDLAVTPAVYRSAFGDRPAEWRILPQDGSFRAEALIQEEPDSYFHLIVVAPDREEMKTIIDQLESYHTLSSGP